MLVDLILGSFISGTKYLSSSLNITKYKELHKVGLYNNLLNSTKHCVLLKWTNTTLSLDYCFALPRVTAKT